MQIPRRRSFRVCPRSAGARGRRSHCAGGNHPDPYLPSRDHRSRWYEKRGRMEKTATGLTSAQCRPTVGRTTGIASSSTRAASATLHALAMANEQQDTVERTLWSSIVALEEAPASRNARTRPRTTIPAGKPQETSKSSNHQSHAQRINRRTKGCAGLLAARSEVESYAAVNDAAVEWCPKRFASTSDLDRRRFR